MIKIGTKEIKIDSFYSGELHLKVDDDLIKELDALSYIQFIWTPNPKNMSQEFEATRFYKRYIDEMRLDATISLWMPYIPHGRMDRDEGGKIFTLKYFTKDLNDLRFDQVIVWDAHSQASLALIDRVYPISHYDIFQETLDFNINFEKEEYQLVMPDLGAYKKYSKMYRSYGRPSFGIKDRAWETGAIESLELKDLDTSKKKFIIIDDICSMGTTFMKTAAAIKKEVPDSEIFLMVSHIEPGAALPQGVLNDPNIKRVFSTDSLEHGIKHSKLTIVY